MKYKLFQHEKALCENELSQQEERAKQVESQARLMVEKYGTTCFDVKQIRDILGIGESNVYRLLRSGKIVCKTIGKRKIVSAVSLAHFLVMDSEE